MSVEFGEGERKLMCLSLSSVGEIRRGGSDEASLVNQENL